VLLSRRVPLRLVSLPVHLDAEPLAIQDVLERLPVVPWHRLVGSGRPLSPSEASHLTDLCIDARLGSVARAASFPDWLGYLGMVLHALERYEINRIRIGTAWAEQFIEMGGDRHAWGLYGHRPMTWRDLELAERQGLGAFELG
jgi:hypothetical protein